MEFANASYLWGFLGLLLPIVIHLWNNKKEQTIIIGSIKMLQESDPKQTNSVQLNERWLLFLRLLIIALLVLILSEPYGTQSTKNIEINYLVEANLLQDNRIKPILDTLPEGSVRVLKNGFPKWKSNLILDDEFPNYWQLAQEMHTIPTDSIVVFASGVLNGVKGKRPQISANTNWIILEPEAAHEKALFANKKEDSAQIHTLISKASVLSFKKDSISLKSSSIEINKQGDSLKFSSEAKNNRIPFRKSKTLRIGIAYPDSLKLQYEFIKAAYRAISKYINEPIEIVDLKEINSLNTSDFTTVISFDTLLPNDFTNTQIQYKPNTFANKLIEKGSAEHIFYLTQLLNSENIINEHLPEQLIQLLSRYEDFDSIVETSDLRILAANELQPRLLKKKDSKTKGMLIPFSNWLWLLLVIILFLERFIAKMRKQ